MIHLYANVSFFKSTAISTQRNMAEVWFDLSDDDLRDLRAHGIIEGVYLDVIQRLHDAGITVNNKGSPIEDKGCFKDDIRVRKWVKKSSAVNGRYRVQVDTLITTSSDLLDIPRRSCGRYLNEMVTRVREGAVLGGNGHLFDLNRQRGVYAVDFSLGAAPASDYLDASVDDLLSHEGLENWLKLALSFRATCFGLEKFCERKVKDAHALFRGHAEAKRASLSYTTSSFRRLVEPQ